MSCSTQTMVGPRSCMMRQNITRKIFAFFADQSGARFIEQEEFWFARERARYADNLLTP